MENYNGKIMCLILFSYKTHPRYSLILAANRDEFYARPTHSLDFWKDNPEILAGRDKLSGGTWLGVTRSGRFAAVTNFRSHSMVKADAPSRGLLVSDFLKGNQSPSDYLEEVRVKGTMYNGFNLLAGDTGSLCYYSNRSREVTTLKPGIYGLSNAFLNTPWPKVEKGVNAFQACVESKRRKFLVSDLFDLLRDRTMPPDHALPNTGVGLAWERLLAPLFISSQDYGTRSSAVLLIENDGNITFSEQTYIPELGSRTLSIRNTGESDESS